MKSRSVSLQLLTNRPAGHTLNRRQVLSPDREWCVIDGRNDDTQIGTTSRIERIRLATGEVESLYEVSRPTLHGPGVGAVAYHPSQERIVFIHGLSGCNSEIPYGAARRYGALFDVSSRHLLPLESRRNCDPVPLGSLSGGTHAHSWSPSGTRVSFTYNDAIDSAMPRTVGFTDLRLKSPQSQGIEKRISHRAVSLGGLDAAPDTSKSPCSNSTTALPDECFLGQGASFLISRCGSHSPFRQALEECWVGESHLAFLGTVPSRSTSPGLEANSPRSEIFLAKLPELIELKRLLEGDDNIVAAGANGSRDIEAHCCIRQLTELSNRTYPGIQGPRHWLCASLDGQWVYSLWRDEDGIVQAIRIHISSGEIRQLTKLSNSIEGQISLSAEGSELAFVSGGSVCIHAIESEETARLIPNRFLDVDQAEIDEPQWSGGYAGAIHFIDNRSLLANRYVRIAGQAYLQVVVIRLRSD